MDVPTPTASSGTGDPPGSPLPTDPSSDVEELDSFDPLEPPPLDWKSDSSGDEDEDEEEVESSATENLTDFTDSLDKASPGSMFLTEVEAKVGENVQTSPQFDKEDANDSSKDEKSEESTSLDGLQIHPTTGIVGNVSAPSLAPVLVRGLDTEEEHDANHFNRQTAEGHREQATDVEERRSLDVADDRPTIQSPRNVYAADVEKDLVEENGSDAKDFNQYDANANQERETNVESKSLDVADDRPTIQNPEDVRVANSEKDFVQVWEKKEQHEAQNFSQNDGNFDLERHGLDSFRGENKTKVYKIVETEFEGSNESRNNLRHLEGGVGIFGFDETQTIEAEPEFTGKEDRRARNPDPGRDGGGFVEDEDHSRIQSLLNQLQLRGEEPEADPRRSSPPRAAPPEARPPSPDADETTGLLFAEDHQRHVVELPPGPGAADVDAVVSVSLGPDDSHRLWGRKAPPRAQREDSFSSQPDDEEPEPVWMKLGEGPPDPEAAAGTDADAEDQPSYKDVPGPCDPEDLLDGVIFGAKYLGSTQLRSDRTPSTNARMAQAQEAVDRIKAPEGETQPMTEVDLFISTKRIKVLTADTQEAMMDHPLQMISYIADIGDIVVLMARRKRKGPDAETQKKCLMICHVFISEDAQVIAQAIGQAFGVAYQQFLQVNGIRASELRPGEYSHYLESQELYNGDLAHFSDAHNLKDVAITKPPGEMLGLAVVESGWGSILPTVVVANLLHGGPAERCGELSIGDRIMSVNGTSLVGLPIHTCQNIIRDLKSQKYVKLSIVHCPPVTMAIIRRPDPKYQLGFSVEDGIICSLMRGGIAERGGIRVGHRIIEINGQSVVATTHDKIIQTLTNAVGEIHLKTMPASTYRLLTGQEQPVYL